MSSSQFSNNQNMRIHYTNSQKKPVGKKTDSALTFKNHINVLCNTASQKLEFLPRVMHYVDVEKM